jgi:hypothetical protein
MKTHQQIVKNIKYIQDEIYRLKQEEDYNFVNNQIDIQILYTELSMLGWVIRKK